MSEYTKADIIKSMKVFFIDNQGSWPTDRSGVSKAKLVGDLVFWPDRGKYPTYVPIAVATHPNYDGKIVTMAGSRGMVVSFIAGARTDDDIRSALSAMDERVDQYRVAVDALVHRMVLAIDETSRDGGLCETSEVEPLAMVAWMAGSEKGKNAAAVIATALRKLLADPETLKQFHHIDAFTVADGLLTSIEQSTAFRGAQAALADQQPVKRRE